MYWLKVPEQERAEQALAEAENLKKVRTKIKDCQDWKAYQKYPYLEEVWASQGVSLPVVRRYGLGFCDSFPVKDMEKDDGFIKVQTLTMPNFFKGRLMDIRHKIITDLPPKYGKYRSHYPGLKPYPFMGDNICTSEPVLIVEGEKKPMIIEDLMEDPPDGIRVAGIPGKNAIKEVIQILRNKEKVRNKIYWLFDPDVAEKMAVKVAQETARLGFPSFVCSSFLKPDEMAREHGIEHIYAMIKYARPVAV